jgi:hypothetical protein
MQKKIPWIYLVFLLFGVQSANARVFKIEEETLATYVKGVWGPSSILQTHFEDTSGTNMAIEDSVAYNLGGEIGIAFTASRAAFRLGVESIHPNPIESKDGTNLSNQILYTFGSDISALLTKADIDFILKSGERWRIFFSLGGGMGTLTYSNSYAFTTDGQTVFTGLADFSEKGTGAAVMYEAAMNFEHLFSDTTTFVFEIGYRQLLFDKITFKEDAATFTGAHLKGDEILNADGTAKSVDFGGPTVAFCFRFYLGK